MTFSATAATTCPSRWYASCLSNAAKKTPSLNQSRLAREAKLDRTDLLRALGLAKAAPTVRNGRREPGEIQTEVGVETAAKIVRALGFDLHQVSGL